LDRFDNACPIDLDRFDKVFSYYPMLKLLFWYLQVTT
jgi:hypothetical protein